ncbi:MAG: DNA/RNA non-specific endonuclease [Alistipes sp.]
MKLISNLFGRYVLLLTAMLFVAVSCSSDDDEVPYLRVFPTSVLFDPTTPVANLINIEANQEWSIIDGTPAPQLDSKSGMGDRVVYILNAPQGQSTFTIIMGKRSCVVTVTNLGGDTPEPGKPYLRVSPLALTFSTATPAANVISIEANDAWTVTAGVPAPTLDKMAGTGNGQIHVTEAPEGKSSFTIALGTIHYTVTVIKTEGIDPDPSGEAVFGKSWAELPSEQVKKGDYYYTYHMRPDAKSVRNFAVCYSKTNLCPVWIAAPMHECYQGSSGRTDAYGQDPSLDFTQPGKWSGYTRGHMLGSSDRTVSRETNKQVFYYSNIAPQLGGGFNTGGGAWNNLEELTDRQWCADTLYQVVGCYWANNNKKVNGTTIPTHYYKILLRTKGGNTRKSVANCSAAELKCVAFVLEHRGQQGLKPNASMLKSVDELEKMTGFQFFPNVPNAPKTTVNASDWGL